MTMLERCARAIEAVPITDLECGNSSLLRFLADEIERKAIVRSVLTELLNPDEGMREVGGRVIAGLSSGRAIQPYEDDASEALQAMIQHILKEGEG